MSKFDATGNLVGIRRPSDADCDEFIAMAQASQAYHYPWVDSPKTRERFLAYVQTRREPAHDGFLICERASSKIAGLINLNNIVRGSFQSAYLGYYVFADFARRGYMVEGMKLVIEQAFNRLGLHRLEANIQPENVASVALVRRCGFQKEGFSPKYLQIFGQWRDHERWALLAD